MTTYTETEIKQWFEKVKKEYPNPNSTILNYLINAEIELLTTLCEKKFKNNKKNY